MKKKAIIIGAGPAGLTAAYELLKRTDIIPIILEKSGDIGGISKTINYKGNRMDMGPHRFFSKSDRVMNWWLHMMPLQESADKLTIHYQNKSREINTTEPIGSNKPIGRDDSIAAAGSIGPEQPINPDGLNAGDTIQGKKDPDTVMLVIQRLTRIYFLRKFFAYPIQLGFDTLKTLGLVRTIKIMVSFLWIRFFPIKAEKSLEDFIINKFGKQLYLLFFKDYTEKVWGVPCHEISAEWGAQRIKGVSLSKAIAQALKTMVHKKKGAGDINQKGTETSLIEQFLYPKKGPGSLWEETARQIEEMGGRIYLHQDVQRIYTHENAITSVNTINSQTGQTGAWEGDYFFSTMPVQELVAGLEADVPEEVRRVAAGLQYRDFINVGILLRKLSSRNKAGGYDKLELKDNWIYIQERDVKVGRLMIYNNWGDGMIKDPNTTWIGMEYFCNKTDAFWALSDESIEQAAIKELVSMDLANADDILDITVRRMEKTYPAYFGTYNEFSTIRAFTDGFENLFLVGRNGMHKYNNADHSMLTAMVAVDNIEAGILSKDNLWSINTEQEYHEEKAGDSATDTPGAGAPEAATPGTGIYGPAGLRTPKEYEREQGIREGEDISPQGQRQSPLGNRSPRPQGYTNTPQETHPSSQEPTAKRPTKAPPYDLLPSFRNYIWKNKGNRAYLLFALAAFLVQFILFKIRYPFANYMPDSYSYLEAAYTNADVNMWPVAYSKFLRQISVFTHSDKIVVGVQYLFMQCSGLLFLFTLLYFLKPGKWVKNILYAFFLFNPVALYVANYISADALFIGMSLCWISSLLWIIYQPRPWQIWVQAILLLACFTIRYNAIYYPLIAALAFILSRQSWPWKLAGIGLGILLVAGSFWYTSSKMLEVTGKRQFSAFGGWQLANNALYMYEHIPAAQRGPIPQRFAKLEGMVREHMDTLKRVKLTAQDSLANFFYLWSDKGPLVQYMVREYKKDTVTPQFKRWASEGPLFSDYASYLIRKYPVQFATEFLLPNSVKYAVPPPEFLGVYNMGGDSVGMMAKEWFNYKTQRVSNHNNKNARIGITNFYPYMSTLVNVFLLLCIVGLAVFTGFKQGDKGLYKTLFIVAFFWLLNMGFSVFASPIVLRYQVFPILISLSLGLLAAEAIVKWGREEELKKKTQLA